MSLLDCYWNATNQIGGVAHCAHLGRLSVLVDRNGDRLCPGAPRRSCPCHCLLRRETWQLAALWALRGGKGRGGRVVLLELGCLSENFTVIFHRRSKERSFLRSLHLVGLLAWAHARFKLNEGRSTVITCHFGRLCTWGYVDHGFEGAFTSVAMEGSGSHSVRYWRIHYFELLFRMKFLDCCFLTI